MFNCLEFYPRSSSDFFLRQKSLPPHAGAAAGKSGFFNFWNQNKVKCKCLETLLWNIHLPSLSHNAYCSFYTLHTFQHLFMYFFKCSTTYFQNTPGPPIGINVLAPYGRQWYELLHRWYIQCACQNSAWTQNKWVNQQIKASILISY